jgi:hypothetical protein
MHSSVDYYGIKTKTEKQFEPLRENYNAFKTKNGRTVYDGGGILARCRIGRNKIEFDCRSVAKKRCDFQLCNQLLLQKSFAWRHKFQL